MRLKLDLENRKTWKGTKETIGSGKIVIHSNDRAEWIPDAGRKNKKLKLHPGQYYCLKLFYDEQDTHIEWNNNEKEHEDLFILRHYQPTPDPHGLESLPFMVWSFQVDNDGVLPKLIRWRFSCQKNGATLIWRLPLHVQPRRRQQLVMMFYSAFGLLFTQYYERLISWCIKDTHWYMLLLKALLYVTGIVFVGFVLWEILVWCWNWTD